MILNLSFKLFHFTTAEGIQGKNTLDTRSKIYFHQLGIPWQDMRKSSSKKEF